MPKLHPQMAKLTRPRLYGAAPRERLFVLLDEARSRPFIYVAGPPGAGKTTLVASWLDVRNVPGIWYQMDSGDADPATLFYYLREAVRPHLRKGRRPPPLLTSEYLHDLDGFSRLFFRELFACLPEFSTLVLDNYQEIASEHKVHHLIAQAASEVPGGQALVAISRRDPPESFARLIANNGVSIVDWNDLKLTIEETHAIAGVKAAMDPREVQALHERSGGWAAGLTLLLERSCKPAGITAGVLHDDLERIFEYFAGQIFERVSPEVQQFMMATAYLPSITAGMAEALTGNDDARAILQDLYRRNLFTHRRPGEQVVYQYHALFREFLQDRAHALFDKGGCRRLSVAAARALETAGQREGAFALYSDAEDWDSACALLLKCAEALLAQGRSHTIIEWTNAFPPKVFDLDPWLHYWRGLAFLATDLKAARALLQSAFDAFATRGDNLGQTMAAAGVLDTCFYDYSDFRPADFWLRGLKKTLASRPEFPSTSAELEVYCAAMIGMLFRQPWDPLLSTCVQRVTEMLEADLDVNRRMAAAVFLLNYCTFSGDFVRSGALLARVRLLAEDPEVSEINRYHWLDWLGYHWFLRGEYVEAERALQEAQAIQEHFSQPVLEVDLWLTRTFIAVNRGDLAVAQRSVQAMDVVARASRPLDRQFCLIARAWLALERDSLAEAIDSARSALSIAEPLGVPFWQSSCRVPLILALIKVDRYDDARNAIDETKVLLRDTCLLHMDSLVCALETLLFLREGREREGQAALRELFANVRRRDHAGILDRLHSVMPDLCAAAWKAKVEPEFIRELIRRFDWPPPSPDVDHWPWPVRIFTLGQFSIECENEPLRFPGKAPRKVLALVKALIAFGGAKVPRKQIIDALWSDEEGDAAEAALDVALARLRKLLGRQDVVVVSNEELTLNRRRCWVDRFAFERMEDGPQCRTKSADRLLSLYKGEFLPTDRDAPWSVRARLRLRAYFSRQVIHLGAELESGGNRREAIALYERGLEADDLVEDFYQGLMRCHLALGSSAEGIGAFRRLRQTLSVVLGVAPSSASNALARDLQNVRPEVVQDV